jgi:ISXO2-like transposase domain
VLGAVAPQTQLVTDDWPSYRNLPGVRHNAITLGPMAAHIALPWIHRLFSNLKRWGLDVYHGLRKTNLQHYLDEFVFRFNRRRTRHAAFDTPARHRCPHNPGPLSRTDPQSGIAHNI